MRGSAAAAERARPDDAAGSRPRGAAASPPQNSRRLPGALHCRAGARPSIPLGDPRRAEEQELRHVAQPDQAQEERPERPVELSGPEQQGTEHGEERRQERDRHAHEERRQAQCPPRRPRARHEAVGKRDESGHAGHGADGLHRGAREADEVAQRAGEREQHEEERGAEDAAGHRDDGHHRAKRRAPLAGVLEHDAEGPVEGAHETAGRPDQQHHRNDSRCPGQVARALQGLPDERSEWRDLVRDDRHDRVAQRGVPHEETRDRDDDEQGGHEREQRHEGEAAPENRSARPREPQVHRVGHADAGHPEDPPHNRLDAGDDARADAFGEPGLFREGGAVGGLAWPARAGQVRAPRTGPAGAPRPPRDAAVEAAPGSLRDAGSADPRA